MRQRLAPRALQTILAAAAAAGALALGVAPAQAAGVVKVSFGKPVAQLSDVGRPLFDGERHVQALTAHFNSLAARLPDGQVLTVEVQDVDMAGRLEPTRLGSELRVMRGGADWPSLDLRWTLQADGRTLLQGEGRISDMNYLMRPLRGRDDSPVGYETRLIDTWFAERVLGGAAPH